MCKRRLETYKYLLFEQMKIKKKNRKKNQNEMKVYSSECYQMKKILSVFSQVDAHQK